MAAMDQIRTTLNSAREWLEAQPLVQQIRSKWSDLDPDKQKAAMIGGATLLVLGGYLFFDSLAQGVADRKTSIQKKTEVLALLDSASTEMARTRALEGVKSGQNNWAEFMKTTAAQAGIDPAKIEISPPKNGTQGAKISESLLEMKIKGINVRHLVQIATGLEGGSPLIKLHALKVDTQGAEGYLDAVFSLSATEFKD